MVLFYMIVKRRFLLRDTFAGKILQKFGARKLFLKSGQIFTGKSVAQPNGISAVQELKFDTEN